MVFYIIIYIYILLRIVWNKFRFDYINKKICFMMRKDLYWEVNLKRILSCRLKIGLIGIYVSMY